MKNKRLPLIAALLPSVGGITGVLVGSAYSSALDTDPAWIGPAILVAGIGALLVGALLVPSAVRAYREKDAP